MAACSALAVSLRSPWCHARASSHTLSSSGVAAAALPPPRQRRRAPVAAAASFSGPGSDKPVASPAAAPSQAPAAASAVPQPGAVAAVAAAVLVLGAAAAGPALALDIHMEPENALSLPTWAVHTSSVIEWITAMGLMWRLGEVSDNPRWKGMAFCMTPSLGSAMCACTWHFFYNSPDLQFLVALQAFLTIVGNTTCWFGALRIYQWAQEQEQGG